MEQKHISKDDLLNIDFVGLMGPMLALSLFLTIGSLILIFTKGLNYGIDFAGGAEIQIKYPEKIHADEVRSWAAGLGFPNAVVQGFSSDKDGANEYLVRVEAKAGSSDQETNAKLNNALIKLQDGVKAKWPNAEIRRIDTVGPQVGNQLKRNGVLALFYSILCILVYVGLRFDYQFAPGAVLCLFHDAVVTLGVFCLLGKEINVQIMAAVLTLIGYSLNDTIVVFDRIREMIPKHKGESLTSIVNQSINSTLNRTILTSLTVFLATLALYLFAGGVIEEFAFAMLVGVILGTYSSIYVASPVLILLERLRKNNKAIPTSGRPQRA